MTKDEYVAAVEEWIKAATEKQARLIWVFIKNYLKK